MRAQTDVGSDAKRRRVESVAPESPRAEEPRAEEPRAEEPRAKDPGDAVAFESALRQLFESAHNELREGLEGCEGCKAEDDSGFEDSGRVLLRSIVEAWGEPFVKELADTREDLRWAFGALGGGVAVFSDQLLKHTAVERMIRDAFRVSVRQNIVS